MLVSAFSYAFISTFPGKQLQDVRRFFLFRDSGNSSQGDTVDLFQWQSILFNLVSFLNLALFASFASSFYNLKPSAIGGLSFYLLVLLIIFVTITIRHLICYLTGRISGERLALSEYIITIYQFYRFLAFILFIITLLLSFTDLLTPKSLIITGFILILSFYLFRLIKLFYIFLNRNISILYLIYTFVPWNFCLSWFCLNILQLVLG